MENQGRWLLCPHCRGKTRIWIREDTILLNFLLFCPKCKQETLVNLKQFQLTVLPQPDTMKRYVRPDIKLTIQENNRHQFPAKLYTVTELLQTGTGSLPKDI